MWQDRFRQIVGERIFIWAIKKKDPVYRLILCNGDGCSLTLCNDELLLECNAKNEGGNVGK